MALRPTEIQLCAGREGDDAFVNIELGKTVDAEMMNALSEVISYAASTYEYNQDEEESPCPEHRSVTCPDCGVTGCPDCSTCNCEGR